MSSPIRKKDTQSAWFDIAVFAVIAAFFLFSARSLTRSQARPASAEAAAQLPERSLASSQQAAPTPATADQSIQVFRLDCLFNASLKPITTEASMVRIMANICSSKKPLAKNTLFVGKNLSSGEDIVPFVQDGKSMSTNYFSLREGSNKISFRLNLAKGQEIQQELEFVKTPKPE
ncbi:MAG: hypothetical protein AB7K68_01880 [Bacteriovoracia bacterium]